MPTFRLAPHGPVLVAISLIIIALRMAWPIVRRWSRTRDARREIHARAAARELDMRRRAWEPTRG